MIGWLLCATAARLTGKSATNVPSVNLNDVGAFR
jgi:hypothetical protein